MSEPQPVLQHPFRRMCGELHAVVRQLAEQVGGTEELDLNEDPPSEESLAGRVLLVATELGAIANGLDLTQGNSEANGYPQWSRDLAWRGALNDLAEMLRRHGGEGS